MGNLLPYYVKTICVDINPSTVTKLMDRGSAQAIGLGTDIGIFLPRLAEEIEKMEGGAEEREAQQGNWKA